MKIQVCDICNKEWREGEYDETFDASINPNEVNNKMLSGEKCKRNKPQGQIIKYSDGTIEIRCPNCITHNIQKDIHRWYEVIDGKLIPTEKYSGRLDNCIITFQRISSNDGNGLKDKWFYLDFVSFVQLFFYPDVFKAELQAKIDELKANIIKKLYNKTWDYGEGHLTISIDTKTELKLVDYSLTLVNHYKQLMNERAICR